VILAVFGLRNILRTREADKADGSACSTDAQLVLAARRGDKEAFVEIVARHQAMVCGITFSILGELAESEDAAQEAFLTAWRKLHTLREPQRLRGWLGEIARNAALGFRRRRRGSETLDETLSMADEAPLPDEVVASEEEASLVRASLAKLPENYRLPLVLYYREGQSVRAVAEALEISEDAVKQRLARGREMLREQMSGVVENVLRRTGPTAVFTMTIAVAIGALAAPAAVAGTAFAAASAGSASASAASTPSLIAVMSTSKGLLVAGALVAVVCLPIGYQVAGSLSGDSRPKAVADAPVVTAKPAPPTSPDFENSALLAEWRHLHDVYGRTPEAMPAIYKAINELKDRFRRQAFGAALVAEWVQLDPTNGLAFFLGKGRDGNQRRQFFQEWLTRDPGAAVNALLASSSGWEGMARDCLNEIAKEAPSRLGEVVARLPKPDYPWEPGVRDAFALLAQGGVDSARVQAEAVTGPNRNQSLEGVAMVWAKQDFNAAVAWARKLPEGADKDEVIRAALLGRAQVDPVGALQNVEMVPSGGTWQRFASSTGARVLEQASQTDFDTTVAWVAANPGHFSRTDLYGLVQQVTFRLNADSAGFL
jgi:RNA polymerase sigma factor (sigma-70 family)